MSGGSASGIPLRTPSEAQRPFEIVSVWALGLKAPVCVCIRDAWV